MENDVVTADEEEIEGARMRPPGGGMLGLFAQGEQGRARDPQQSAQCTGTADGPWRDAFGMQEVRKLTSPLALADRCEDRLPEITLNTRYALHRLVPRRGSVRSDASQPRMSFSFVPCSTTCQARKEYARDYLAPLRNTHALAAHHGISRKDGERQGEGEGGKENEAVHH